MSTDRQDHDEAPRPEIGYLSRATYDMIAAVTGTAYPEPEGYQEAIDALRDEVAFWTFMETHPLGEDAVEVANNPGRVCADYLEARRIAETPAAVVSPPSEDTEMTAKQDPQPFGFNVEYEEHTAPWGGETSKGFRVSLPHQCDEWDIVGEYLDPVPRAEAIAELERFITEAQAALAELRTAPEVRAAVEE